MKYYSLICMFMLFLTGCGTTRSVGKLCGTDVQGNTVEFVAVDFEGLSGHSKVIMRVVRNTDGQIVSNEPIWAGGGSSVWPSVISGGSQVGSAYYIGKGLGNSGDDTTNNNVTTGGSSNAAAGAAAVNINRNSVTNDSVNANLNANR